MKKMFYSLAVLALVTIFASCGKSPEKMIVGTWKLNDVQIENMDAYAQSILDMQTSMLDGQVKQVADQVTAMEAEIKTIKDKKAIEAKNAELAGLKSQLDGFNTQKAGMTLESVKAQFQTQFDQMKEQFKMIFNVDKSFENPLDGSKGTYEFSADAKSLITKDAEGKADSIMITLLEAEKMVLALNQKQGELTLKMTMTFAKEKAEAAKEETKDAPKEEKK